MEYTIGQVAKLTGLSISTIRYYDKEGLLNGINRKSGIRSFNDKDLNTIRVIECLKNSGMLIKEIRDFMKLCEEGDSSLNERYNFFLDQEKKVQDQIKSLNQTVKLIKFKQWYYLKAISDNTESIVKNMSIDDMPDDIKELYLETHNDYKN
ncbi:MAG TPA: MerR family transcriptional regulator [Firmicutes bacterium]|nr:MerR family transcriptional regulator [Bacillota bacterium]HAX01029.1 MerR family transcriptional regulator [Bacillota bacterium]